VGGNDQLFGDAGNDSLIGLFGSDTLWGGNGNDFLVDWGDGNNELRGGKGDDLYFDVGVGDRVIEAAGEGYDRVETYLDDYVLTANVEQLTIFGGGSARGNGLANRISGHEGSARLEGLGGNDTIDGGGGDVTLDGGTGSDFLRAEEGDDSLIGGGGNDSMVGGAGSDTLLGGDGIDTLKGNDGDDRLVGGPGADLLIGGLGQDTFVFLALADSTSGTGTQLRNDRILPTDPGSASPADAFEDGDRIDVSAIDANSTVGGNQAFIWGGALPSGSGTPTKGWLFAVDAGAFAVILGNVDNDADLEFRLEILDEDFQGEDWYLATDFIL
jgi:Ca2+-binding RTX toxin-like protein